MLGITRQFQMLLMLVLVLIGFHANAQINRDSIDAICKKVIDPNGPAVGLLITKDGKVAYKKAFGYENIELKKRASTSTQFNIASVSKSFAAAAIMQLAEIGRLSVTDTMGKYLKGYALGSKITIHQLLSHTSGLSDTSGTYAGEKLAGVTFVPFLDSIKMIGVDPVRNLYLQYVLNGYNAKYPPPVDYVMIDTFLLFAPGTQYKYSNRGYVLLAKIVEGASGVPYNEYLRKNFFVPAGMVNSFSYNGWNDKDISRPANTYMWMNDGSYRKMFERVPDDEGSTNVYTTIDDWVHYEKLLAGGIPAVLGKRSLAQIFTEHITYRNRATIKGSYGYGWQIIERYGTADTIHVIQHSGGTLGSSAYRICFKDQNIVVAIFYSQMHEGFTKYKWIDLINEIESYLKRNKMLPE